MKKEVDLLNEVERKLKLMLTQYHSNPELLIECAADVAFVRDQLRHLTKRAADKGGPGSAHPDCGDPGCCSANQGDGVPVRLCR